MQATAKAIEATRGHLAAAGVFYFVSEYKRKLEGFSLLKRLIFRVLRKANRLACTRLGLPTIIYYDQSGPFWIEYCGGFTHKESAVAAIQRMRAERIALGKSSQFELTELPMNGVLPEATGRYGDQEFVGEYIFEFYREQKGPVICPYKKTPCTPEEVISRVDLEPLFRANAEVDAALNQ